MTLEQIKQANRLIRSTESMDTFFKHMIRVVKDNWTFGDDPLKCRETQELLISLLESEKARKESLAEKLLSEI